MIDVLARARARGWEKWEEWQWEWQWEWEFATKLLAYLSEQQACIESVSTGW